MESQVIRIIDYQAGNAPSVLNAVVHLSESNVDKPSLQCGFARTAADLADASHIILPGVGSAGATMQSLAELGILEALADAVLTREVYFMGICVGMQVLFEHSDEEDADCLGWLKGRVVRYDTDLVRVPQMGWNQVNFSAANAVTPSPMSDYFYFVNSYYALPSDPGDVWATADYGIPFTAAVNRRNIYATQFHLEKSGEAGLAVLGRFLDLGQDGMDAGTADASAAAGSAGGGVAASGDAGEDARGATASSTSAIPSSSDSDSQEAQC
jgi:glutamine amidotransferase